MTAAQDVEAVRAAALDYVEGWFDGDEARMERALHSELVKRDLDQGAVRTLSARRMIDLTAEGEGRREDAEDRQIEVEIEHLSGDIASVTCLPSVGVALSLRGKSSSA
jgi:hypothetical protein